MLIDDDELARWVCEAFRCSAEDHTRCPTRSNADMVAARRLVERAMRDPRSCEFAVCPRCRVGAIDVESDEGLCTTCHDKRAQDEEVPEMDPYAFADAIPTSPGESLISKIFNERRERVAAKLKLQCPTCKERLELPELHGDQVPCDACGKKAVRFSYASRETGHLIWCEDIECRWQVADAHGISRDRLAWCSCSKTEKAEVRAHKWQTNPPVHHGELRQEVLVETPYTVSQWSESGLSAVYKDGQQEGTDYDTFDIAKERAEYFARKDQGGPAMTKERYEQSFSRGEIQALDFIVQTLLRGGTPTMVTRHKEFASLCRKVMALKAAVRDDENG